MAYINDQVFVQGLSYAVANGSVLRLCTQEPTNYAEALTYQLANSNVIVSSPVEGAIDGMRVIIPTVSEIPVISSGTISYWALTSGETEEILVSTGLLNTPTPVLINNLVDFNETVDITLRDAV